MPIYFSWFITALLSVSGDLQQSQPTAKWAPFILREIACFRQPSKPNRLTSLPSTGYSLWRGDMLRLMFILFFLGGASVGQSPFDGMGGNKGVETHPLGPASYLLTNEAFRCSCAI